MPREHGTEDNNRNKGRYFAISGGISAARNRHDKFRINILSQLAGLRHVVSVLHVFGLQIEEMLMFFKSRPFGCSHTSQCRVASTGYFQSPFRWKKECIGVIEDSRCRVRSLHESREIDHRAEHASLRSPVYTHLKMNNFLFDRGICSAGTSPQISASNHDCVGCLIISSIFLIAS